MWIDLLVTITVGAVLLLFIKSLIRKFTLLKAYFSAAALFLLVPYSAGLFQIETAFQLQEWAKLISITIYISGLLVLIRESKPVFARFPKHLTALPFISFIFFPLIINSFIIKDLLNAVYQGGALAVTVLIFTINNARKSQRRYYILGISLVTAAYLSYWLFFNRNPDYDYIWISEILMSAGILITALRFLREQVDS
ncbi:hypothetical protein SAMN06265219_101316 [Gracilimonas mengyeensis]|uniref:Uncharacterized protein n=2 Tax=Gracilimonas mengyeensis TaxID=1302730 RepID=A0A521AQQ9_9BACT|nr:hypothetical protein SAMN06265219_101316 [Gracilimonas mengyeensis]